MNVEINGAQIYFTIPILGGIPITATIVNGALVTIVILALCRYLTRNLQVRAVSRRQVIAEFLVETAQKFVNENMGVNFAYYGPFVAALFSASLCSSLLSLLGMFAPTSDLSTTAAWAVMVFVLITYTKIKTGGVGGYLLGFTQPIPVLTPFNILSELATPISMAFRHFGNVVSGSVISSLVYAALAAASVALISLLSGTAVIPAVVVLLGAALLGTGIRKKKTVKKILGGIVAALGALGVLGYLGIQLDIPVLQMGIPAVLSVYFDLFSSAMQAFIFCMLTTLYIASAAETD